MRHLREWAQLIAVTGVAQVAVQALGFVSGILVIRLLPVHEYALYTLANTMLGTMTVLADSGIAAGVMSQGGKVWQDRKKLGAVLATGMNLRRKFAVFSLLVAVPILFVLLRRHDASLLVAMLTVLSLIQAFFSSLSGKLLEVPPKLHQDVVPLQRFQVEANLGRLALMGITIFVFPFASVAIVCAGISQVWNNWRLRKASSGYALKSDTVDLAARDAILQVVKRAMPGAIYYAFSGQLSVWLLSIFGNNQTVAQIGALGRLATLTTLIGAIYGMIVIPRYSRIPDQSKSIVVKYVLVQVSLMITLLLVLVPVYVFSDLMLYIIGKDYNGLNGALLLSVASAMLSMMSGLSYQINSNRGVIIPPLIYFPLLTSYQIVLAVNLRVDTLTGVLLISLFVNLAAYAAISLHGLYRANKTLSLGK